MRQYLSTKPGRNAPLLPTKSDPLLLPPEDVEGGGTVSPPSDPPADWWWEAPLQSPTYIPPATTEKTLGCTGNKLLVGSAQWERSLWRYGFITDLRPPLFLARGFYEGQGLLPGHMAGLDTPCCPVTAAPLLYMAPPAHPFCACTVPLPTTGGGSSDDGSPAGTGGSKNTSPASSVTPDTCHHFHICAKAWRVADSPVCASGATGVLRASRQTQAQTQALPAPTSTYPSSVLIGGAYSGAHQTGLRAAGGAEGLHRRSGSGGGGFPFQALLVAVRDYAESVHPTRAIVRSWSVLERHVVFERISAASGSGAPSQCTILVAERATLNMQGNRYCHRIGRAHRSNNVNFTIDFAQQVVRQTCMDWECRQARYRSEPLPIGTEAFPDQSPGPQFTLLPSQCSAR